MKDFYAIIMVKHEEAMKSRLPAAFHKILGRRVIDYMLLNLAEMKPRGIFVLLEEQYLEHMEKTPVEVICKTVESTTVEDIKAKYGGDVEYVILDKMLPHVLSYDVLKIMSDEENEDYEPLDRLHLYEYARLISTTINVGHTRNGVSIIKYENTRIGPDVKIGMDTIIYPGVIIEGNTTIGENCIIGQNCRLVDMKIGDNVEIWDSTCLESEIGDGTSVGPYAYLRPGSVVGKDCKIGNFVEVKNAIVGDGSKASHLSYIGDAHIGKDVNFGCGAITVNYDGKKKHRTIVEDDAFIGCNTNLIAPVTVGKGAYTAAGSTITDDVPPGDLGIARARQVNKENWVARRGDFPGRPLEETNNVSNFRTG